MFERYTEHARRVIFFARYEASQLGDNYITPEHLLLGYFRENVPALTKLLDAAAVNAISAEIRAKKTNQKVATSVDLPLSNGGKRVLAYAAEEAERQSNPHIGGEHLFLAILREESSEAAQLLEKFGVTIDSARGWANEAKTVEAEQHTDPAWLALGLPAGYGSPRLFFNGPSETVVLLARSRAGILPTSRLFVRHKNATKYEPIPIKDGPISCESPVISGSTPLLVFNTMRCEKMDQPRRKDGVAYHWRAIEIFDLSRMTGVRSIARSDLILPAPYDDCWVSSLLGLSSNDSILTAVCACRLGNSRAVDYFVAALDLRSLKIELLTKLDGFTY